jgi:hypothetical protein
MGVYLGGKGSTVQQNFSSEWYLMLIDAQSLVATQGRKFSRLQYITVRVKCFTAVATAVVHSVIPPCSGACVTRGLGRGKTTRWPRSHLRQKLALRELYFRDMPRFGPQLETQNCMDYKWSWY